MRIALGSDHAGFEQKNRLVEELTRDGYDVIDVGCADGVGSVDYPNYAVAASRHVTDGTADRAILVCGTGIGMAMTANKLPGIRAANATTPQFAQLARQHNDANVLTLSGRFVDAATNSAIAHTFLSTDYEGARHQQRLDKIAELEH